MKKKSTQKSTIQAQPHYTKVGRLRKPIAKQIRRVAADIYISENHLKHIFIRHEDEMENIGLTPQMFIDLVLNGFNRIYKGKNEALLLVLWNCKPKVTIIELNLALEKEFYEIITATIMRKEYLEDRELLWKKEKRLV
ncbi:MAG: hypothetical protein LBH22_08855 [Bacteroidales bacterium]|jgi:hypothetical protein|nr:hypothetical protein [Bacteroidales bacterium]